MLRHQVYLVGPRYHHHAGHSGYESFQRYGGTFVRSPVKRRFFSGRFGRYPLVGDLGRRIDQAVAALTPRPLYSVGILLIEVAAGLHMLTHRRSLYHVLYGDTDVWLLGYFSRMTGSQLVATFHEPAVALEWLAIDKIVHNLDAVILMSESQRAYFEKSIPSERIFVVPHGVDTDFFQPAERLSEQPICITVGAHRRDFETLRQAIDIIHLANPQVRFLAVGTRQPGDENSQFYDDRVEFLSNLSDEELRQAYQISKVAIFSFHYATANNAMLEAMACGLPIVATDVGGVHECIGNKTGFLCPQYNPEALATGVLQVLNDKPLAAKMALASRERALKFDYRMIASQMNQLYAKIINKRSR